MDALGVGGARRLSRGGLVESPFDALARLADEHLPLPKAFDRIDGRNSLKLATTKGDDLVHLVSCEEGLHQSYAMSVSPKLIAKMGERATKGFLNELSGAWDLDIGRSFLDPERHALWPDEWDGALAGVGWFQYFGPTLAARWSRDIGAGRQDYTVEWHAPGGLTVCAKGDPLKEPSHSVRVQIASDLGIELRDG
jgi:hypothetical protein